MTITDESVRLDEEVKTTNNGDHDRYQHYFSAKDINNNLLTGQSMTALCGRVVSQQVDPKGRTICHECQEILDELFPEN